MNGEVTEEASSGRIVGAEASPCQHQIIMS
jgi:hypothetical protein